MLIKQHNATSQTAIAAGLFVVLLAGLVFEPATAQNTAAEEKGFDIAARSDRSDLGFASSEVDAIMTLTNAAGKTSTREMYFKTLEKVNEQVGDRSLTVFETPRDVQGTALLSHAKILTADDQWLYLPALKRVKRISSANKSGPFVGSEFAFEDLTSTELNKYGYKFVGEETFDGMTVDVVERTPLYSNSGYIRQVSYVDQEIFQVRKVDFYDRKNSLLKTLTLSNFKEYEGGIWRAQLFTMNNHQTGKSTSLAYGDYKFKTGLAERDFVKGVLKRIR